MQYFIGGFLATFALLLAADKLLLSRQKESEVF